MGGDTTTTAFVWAVKVLLPLFFSISLTLYCSVSSSSQAKKKRDGDGKNESFKRVFYFRSLKPARYSRFRSIVHQSSFINNNIPVSNASNLLVKKRGRGDRSEKMSTITITTTTSFRPSHINNKQTDDFEEHYKQQT